ncbi:phage tail protein [Enterococcus dispar]|uniref:phage tail protein n=1 Tax=Enterococcus dispar TaxID=44009 RepID=UPI00288EAE50|nr:PblA [Enterococcus dispar]MDT2704805.1 PblA [Enterococcus dispar]
MATELGQAYVQIMPSAKGISGSIQKQLDPEASSAGKSAGLKIGTGLKVAAVAGVAAAGAAMGKIISSSLSEGANLQQSLGGIETLFKGSANKVIKYADQAYKTSGLSANDYMENVTSFSASLLQSVAGDTNKAAETANMAMIDMSDNANKMGTNMGDIQNAYQGFAKQNYTMLDNLKLGYGGTKEEMQRLLTDAQKLTGVKYNINNLNDVYNAIHAVQGKLGITGTTAKEAAETFSGSFAAMKASLSNVLGNLSLGRDIGPSLQALAQTVSTFLFGNFIPMVGNILGALPGAIITFFAAAAPLFMQAGGEFLTQISAGFTTGLPNFMTTLSGIITSMMSWITMNLPTILNIGVQILTNIANGILQAIPQLITIAGNIITSFVEFFMVNFPVILETGKNLLLNLIDGIIANLPAIGDSAIQAVSTFIDTIVANYPKYMSTGWEILMSLVKGILDRLPDLISAAATLIIKFASMLISKIPSILAAGAQIMAGLVGKLISLIPNILSAGVRIIGGLISGIVRAIPDVLRNIAGMGNDIVRSVTGIDISGAGAAIMNGFLGGLKSAYEGVKNFVGGIASWIKEHKGPISYDKKLLIPAGQAIMGGLNSSLQDAFKQVQKTVSSMGDELQLEFGINVNADEFSNQNFERDVVANLANDPYKQAISTVPVNSATQDINRTIEISVPVYLYKGAAREIGYATATYVDERNQLNSRRQGRLEGDR